MGILNEQMRISDQVVNGRDIDIGDMFAKGHAVALSQQSYFVDRNDTSGYYSGSIQGGSSGRKNLYPDNNRVFVALKLHYKTGLEEIRGPNPPREPSPPSVVE